jgi:hypothetical protein
MSLRVGDSENHLWATSAAIQNPTEIGSDSENKSEHVSDDVQLTFVKILKNYSVLTDKSQLLKVKSA